MPSRSADKDNEGEDAEDEDEDEDDEDEDDEDEDDEDEDDGLSSSSSSKVRSDLTWKLSTKCPLGCSTAFLFVASSADGFVNSGRSGA
ncbi:hypothetical protein [Endozoicomonas lisbonensis]|uniref:hypothetical protein n=1 Tax=Endozoicomonas lisbonensis TaxID=3120522 RepID=UPI003399BC17